MSDEDDLPSKEDSLDPFTPINNISVHGAQVAASYLHIGPLPDPATLRKYQDISPQLMNSIVDAFVSQGEHRKSIERWIYKGGTVRSILGVVFAFVMGMSAILAGAYIVLHGYPVSGTIFGGFGIAGIIRSFLTGTRLGKNKESNNEETEDEQ